MEEHSQIEISPSLCPKCNGALEFAPDRDCLVCKGCGRIDAIRGCGRKPAGLPVESHLNSVDKSLENPTALLPFRLSRQQAIEKVRLWLAGEGLSEVASIELTEAICRPFILFRHLPLSKCIYPHGR